MNTIEPAWRIDATLRSLRPTAIAALNEVNARAWATVSPVLLELIRLRVGALIGNSAGLLRRSTAAAALGLTEAKIAALDSYYRSNDFLAAEKRCLSFAEQFVIDVSSITPSDVTDLAAQFSAGQHSEFVAALFVTEFTQRLEILAPMLLRSSAVADAGGVANTSPESAPHSEQGAGNLMQCLERYQEAVVKGAALDPGITEMVRLRCARTHDCRICKTLRLSDARQFGVDESMTQKIDYYEQSDLEERIKTALRITDAFITRPDTLSEKVLIHARSIFSPEELAELCLDISKWSTQKVYVALGTDSADLLPTNAQGLSFFSFDADGRVAGFVAES